MKNTRKIRYIVRFSLTVTIVLLLNSCVHTLTLSNIAQLRNGMTSEQTRLTVKTPPKHQFILHDVNPPDIIEVQTYILINGIYFSCYFLAFQNNKLIYWGYPHEFARIENPLINDIGRKAVRKLNN